MAGLRPDHLEHLREVVAVRVVVQDRGYRLQLAEPAGARDTRLRVEVSDPQQGARVESGVTLRAQREEEAVVRLAEGLDSLWAVVCQPVVEACPRWEAVAAGLPRLARVACTGAG